MVAAIGESEADSQFHRLERWYAPWVIEGILREWHAVLDARPRREDEPRIRLMTHDWSMAERIHRKAEIERALRWLRTLFGDPEAAEAIELYYQATEERHWPIEEIADWLGVTERTVYNRINRGIRRMANYLGWIESEEET